MSGWRAFTTGLSQALRHRRVLIVLFAVNLVGALLLAALPAASLAAGLGHRPAVHQAADGVDGWFLIETLMSSLIDTTLGQGAGPKASPALPQVAALGLFTAAALPLLAWLPAAFFGGGALLTYAEASPRPFQWRRFLWGCWHWFGAFLLLGLIQGIVALALFVPLTAAVAASAFAGGWWLWVTVVLLALVAVLWLAVTDLSYIVAVVSGTRHALRAFGGAVRFVLRNLGAMAGLYGLALLLTALLHALFRWGLLAHLPLEWWPLVLLVQQTFILARLAARLARLAGGVILYQARVDRQISPPSRGSVESALDFAPHP